MDQINDLVPFLEMRVDRKTAIDHLQADLDDDGGLTRSEFVEMCTVVLAKVPLGRLAMAAENYQNGIPCHGIKPCRCAHTDLLLTPSFRDAQPAGLRGPTTRRAGRGCGRAT